MTVSNFPGYKSPLTLEECGEKWEQSRTITVPAKRGLATLHIIRICRLSSFNGKPLDLLIKAQRVVGIEPVEFGMLFRDEMPDKRDYTIPILWRKEQEPGPGKWL